MIKLKRLLVKNFKKFSKQSFDFNDDINILVGDNDSGKSSILEAVELVLNFTNRGRPLSPELMAELFNATCIDEYLAGDHSQVSLPELLIEAFVDGDPELLGDNNSERSDTQGISLKIKFNSDLSTNYAEFIKAGPVITLPFELYKIEWQSFAWKPLVPLAKPVDCLFVDPSRIHPTQGRSRYINGIINASIERGARPILNLSYRQLKVLFNERPEVVAINEKINDRKDITSKDLKIVADITPAGSWDSNLTLAVDGVAFAHIGKGEQSQIQIKVAIKNRATDMDIVMLEEPESHLSHMNLTQLVSYIEEQNSGKQVLITTHSSYVLNKISIEKLCLISHSYTRMKEIDPDTAKTLKRLPGYDTLRLVLARKVILVEGPSDELVLKKIYLNNHERLPEHDGIDIIVVRGIGFRVYLDIAKALTHPVRVVKDNDGNYKVKIVDWKSTKYPGCDFIQCFSPISDNENSLEPALIAANSGNEKELDTLAEVMLSAQTLKEYAKTVGKPARESFLVNWFKDAPGKKVDSAIRIFESKTKINYPSYLVEALTFDA